VHLYLRDDFCSSCTVYPYEPLVAEYGISGVVVDIMNKQATHVRAPMTAARPAYPRGGGGRGAPPLSEGVVTQDVTPDDKAVGPTVVATVPERQGSKILNIGAILAAGDGRCNNNNDDI
jgi:hypothetical protein